MEVDSKDTVPPPYPPSWADRLMDMVDQAGPPPWLIYAASGVLLTLVFGAVQAWQGAYADQGFQPWHLFIAIQPLYPIVITHYLDNIAVNSLDGFQQAMVGDQHALRMARYRLTTTPARGVLIASLLGAGALFVLFIRPSELPITITVTRISDSNISLLVFALYMILTWFGYGMWAYHTIHQLREIHSLYTHQSHIDPFHPAPLYALSRISSRSALVILPISYGWLTLNASAGVGNLLDLTSMIVTNIFFVGLGVLIFIWPLWGAHQLLEEVKEQALADNAAHFGLTVEQLHGDVAQKRTADMAAWENALSALSIERGQLEKLATWPWAPGALRNLLAALIIPLIVWAAQFALEGLLD